MCQQQIIGLEHYTLSEIRKFIYDHFDFLEENFAFYGLDFSIDSIEFIGSRINGKPKKNSDLDVKVIYSDNEREDDIFNALNDKANRLYIENILVDFYTERSFLRPGNWATHKSDWRGNWSLEVARNLILRYSKEKDHLLDCMIGGGTTAIEAKILNRHITCIDVNEKALERTKKSLEFEVENTAKQRVMRCDARDMSFIKDGEIDFVLTHPPYVDIIKYSEGAIEEDLSGIHDIDAFVGEKEKVAKELFRVLKKGKYCAILMGDTRRNKMYQLLAFKVMEKFLKIGFVLKEDIIKRQFNCKATGFWVKKSKESNFLLIMHEHLFIFQK